MLQRCGSLRLRPIHLHSHGGQGGREAGARARRARGPHRAGGAGLQHLGERLVCQAARLGMGDHGAHRGNI
eukprot:SM002186S06545  [mRNA]  locus=s2186:1081:1639:- [translate_table: standard]